MTIKTGAWIGLTVAAGCIFAGVVVVTHHPNPPATPVAVKVARKSELPHLKSQPSRVVPLEAAKQRSPEIATAAEPQPVTAEPPTAPLVEKPAKPRQNFPPVDPTASEQIGRFALSLVGIDTMAEHVWIQAINDPSLPLNARKDLIEDLNQDGFPDHNNVTTDDLPLIVSRLALIEELAPDAMDEVNLAAFQEAYKDLTNMLVKLAQP